MFSMLGVRPQSLHRIWAEQRSTSTAEGQHMCSRVPVHASHLAPKQVIHAQIFRNAHVLCIIFAAAPPPWRSSVQDLWAEMELNIMFLMIFSLAYNHLRLFKLPFKISHLQREWVFFHRVHHVALPCLHQTCHKYLTLERVYFLVSLLLQH